MADEEKGGCLVTLAAGFFIASWVYIFKLLHDEGMEASKYDWDGGGSWISGAMPIILVFAIGYGIVRIWLWLNK